MQADMMSKKHLWDLDSDVADDLIAEGRIHKRLIETGNGGLLITEGKKSRRGLAMHGMLAYN
jgi:hypothetical protein